MDDSFDQERMDMMFAIHSNMEGNDTFALEVSRVSEDHNAQDYDLGFTWTLCLHHGTSNRIRTWRTNTDGVSCSLEEEEISKIDYWDYEYQEHVMALGIIRRFKPEHSAHTVEWIKTAIYEAFGPIHRQYLTSSKTKKEPKPFPILALVTEALRKLENRRIINLQTPIDELENWSKEISTKMDKKKLGHWVHPPLEVILHVPGDDTLKDYPGASRDT